MRYARHALALLAVVAFTAGCDVSVSTTPTVEKSTLEKEVKDRLATSIGAEMEKVECPDDLKGDVGEVMTCKLDYQGDRYDVTVTVTSVEDTTVKFDAKVVGQST